MFFEISMNKSFRFHAAAYLASAESASTSFSLSNKDLELPGNTAHTVNLVHSGSEMYICISIEHLETVTNIMVPPKI